MYGYFLNEGDIIVRRMRSLDDCITKVLMVLMVLQLMGAVIIGGIGIFISVKFININQEYGTPYENALEYVDNPWTTKYIAGLWVAIIITIAVILAVFAWQKGDDKPRYIDYTVGANVVTFFFTVVLGIFSHRAISWYKTCLYMFINEDAKKVVGNCTSEDKLTGTKLYTVNLVISPIVAIVTMMVILVVVYDDENFITRIRCGGRTEAHEFNAQSAEPQPPPYVSMTPS